MVARELAQTIRPGRWTETKKRMNSIALLRKIALIEGVSFLILLFIAMPLKYIWDRPQAVRVVGMAHGFLWVLFCLSLLQCTLLAKWPLGRAALVFMASIIPFGPWLVDRRLKGYEQEYLQQRGLPASRNLKADLRVG